jgi:hypothetical protein
LLLFIPVTASDGVGNPVIPVAAAVVATDILCRKARRESADVVMDKALLCASRKATLAAATRERTVMAASSRNCDVPSAMLL